MNSFFGNLGTVGLAVVLTVVLVVGIPGGGKLKPLGWWTTVFVSLFAADTYAAAGGVFRIVPDAAGSVVHFANGVIPGLTLPALALSVLAFMLWKRLTTRQVAVVSLVFFYVASAAGGPWSYFTHAIANARGGA